MKEKWQQLAADLGFEFKQGIEAFTSSERLGRLVSEDFTRGSDHFGKAAKFLESPFIKKLMARFFVGVATGQYKDCEFALFRSSSSTGSNNRTYFVNIVLLLPRDYQLGMEVTYSGFWGRLNKRFFPGNKVQLPDPELDRLLLVKAKNKTQAQALLADSRIRWKLLEMFQASKNFKITDSSIRYKEVGHIITKEKALEKMDLMAATASCFY